MVSFHVRMWNTIFVPNLLLKLSSFMTGGYEVWYYWQLLCFIANVFVHCDKRQLTMLLTKFSAMFKSSLKSVIYRKHYGSYGTFMNAVLGDVGPFLLLVYYYVVVLYADRMYRARTHTPFSLFCSYALCTFCTCLSVWLGPLGLQKS